MGGLRSKLLFPMLQVVLIVIIAGSCPQYTFAKTANFPSPLSSPHLCPHLYV